MNCKDTRKYGMCELEAQNEAVSSNDWFDLTMKMLEKEEMATRALHKCGRLNNQRANGHIEGINGAREVALRVKARMKTNTEST